MRWVLKDLEKVVQQKKYHTGDLGSGYIYAKHEICDSGQTTSALWPQTSTSINMSGLVRLCKEALWSKIIITRANIIHLLGEKDGSKTIKFHKEKIKIFSNPTPKLSKGILGMSRLFKSTTYLLDLGTTISASVSYCLIQSCGLTQEKVQLSYQRKNKSYFLPNPEKRKKLWDKWGNSTIVSISQIYLTKEKSSFLQRMNWNTLSGEGGNITHHLLHPITTAKEAPYNSSSLGEKQSKLEIWNYF